jgi:hypothetical protein
MLTKIAQPAPEMRTAKTPPTLATVNSSAPPSSAAACVNFHRIQLLSKKKNSLCMKISIYYESKDYTHCTSTTTSLLFPPFNFHLSYFSAFLHLKL